MEWVETTGKTLEEARDAALDMLGVDESDAEFVTLSEPRPGLFGRLRGEARVRARVVPRAPAPKRTRSRRPGQRRDSAQRPQSDETKTPSGATRATSAKPRSPRSKVASKESEDSEELSGTTSAQASAAGPGAGKSRSARRRRRRSTGTGGSGGSESTKLNGSEDAIDGLDEDSGNDFQDRSSDDNHHDGAKPVASSTGATQRRDRQRKPAKTPLQDEEETVTDTPSLEEQGEMAKRFIEGLVAELGMEATVTSQTLNDEAVQVAVDGEELGLLVGKGGATLSAIQELARTVVQRQTGGHTERILVDVAGYRARRAEALTRFTQQVVEDVVASGKEKALEAMSPADRKVVHDAVNEIGGASTRSEGIEPHRHVVISPAAAVSPVELEEASD